jgi:hypothetical protein
MSFFGKDGQPDMRMMLGIVLLGIVGALTFVADNYTFNKRPPGVVEKMIASPALLGYELTKLAGTNPENIRIPSDAIAFITYLVVGGGVGFVIWRKMVRHVLEPWEAKEYWRRKVRRQDLLDQYWPNG